MFMLFLMSQEDMEKLRNTNDTDMKEFLSIQRDDHTKETIEEQATHDIKNDSNGEGKKPGAQYTSEPDVPQPVSQDQAIEGTGSSQTQSTIRNSN